MSPPSEQQHPNWADLVDDPNRYGERFTEAQLIARDIIKATEISRFPCYMPVRNLILKLSGGDPELDTTTGRKYLSDDEMSTLFEILDNMIQLPSLKEEKFLGVWKKKLMSPKPDQPVFLSNLDFRKFAESMEWLPPVEFFTATKLERFKVRWKKESHKRGCQDISEYATEPETLMVLQTLDGMLRNRLQTYAKIGSGTTISANSALILLLRIKQYLKEGHASIGSSAEVPTSRIITKLMSDDKVARTHLSSQEVAVLDQLYCHLTDILKPGCELADQQTPPSKYAKNLFRLELHATYWLEHIIDITYELLTEEKIPEAEFKSRMDYVLEKLGQDTFKPFIPKAALLEAFHRNIPAKPQDPCFMGPEHVQCAEKIQALQNTIEELTQWATNLAFPLLDDFGTERAKLGTCPVDILTNAVPKLVAIRKKQSKELLEEKARIDKFCKNAVKREGENRTKKEELRTEIKARDRQIEELKKAAQAQSALKVGDNQGAQDIAELQRRLKEEERQLRNREDNLKIQEADFKALQRKNQKSLQKDSKTSDSQLRIEQGKVADLEKRLHTSDEALRILQLDFDAVSTDLQELKSSNSASNATASSESTYQASIKNLQEEVERYKGLYQATRSNKEIIRDQIDKAVREKNKELSDLRDELQASQKQLQDIQKQPADKSIDYEEKVLADLATRDETIQDLSRANIGLRDTISAKDAEIMRLKKSRAAAVKLLLD